MLNMDRLNKANEAMKENRLWDLDTVFATVAKVSFNLWDYHFPKNFETVMTQLMTSFKSYYRDKDLSYIYCKFCSTYLINMSGENLVKVISHTLHLIPEYLEWNELNEYGFFIDLTAFDQNVFCELRSHIIMSEYFEVSENE